MKRILLFWVLAMCAALPSVAQSYLHLTPRAKYITSYDAAERVVVPQTFNICVADKPDSIVREATRFADALKKAAGIEAHITTEGEGAFILLDPGSESLQKNLGEEGYRILIRAEYGVKVFANTTVGYYYAFQTLKKMLPPNVMAGVRDTTVTDYYYSKVTINDMPRFSYRGFMLDCSRHFYTVDEIKRMLDVMSYYKMNRFHWHLTDDQGWRAEIKKYPRLTEVGSISPNTLINSMTEGKYWLNKPYGPYYYTQDDMREVVRYAAEHHIEVLPEIEVPGHMQAAIASYPWLSCTPDGDHTIWSNGGISSDVLNVANPNAVDFVKDILAELIDIFPYPYFHVGGDETPTSAWAANPQCQALKQQLGLTTDRALQSYFTHEISEYLRSKGRTPIFWNESISSSGADRDMVKATGATIMCWTGAWAAAKDAAGTLGLDCIYTPWRNWYINTAQSRDAGEPSLAGDGSNTVQVAYNEEPTDLNLPASAQEHYKGVQGTFWCEHVNEIAMVEYAAMPRLQAIAEVGWTPKKDKDWNDFRDRMNQDTTLLNYNGYHYGRHIMDGYKPKTTSTPAADAAPLTLETGKTYRFTNTAPEFIEARLVDSGEGNAVRHSASRWDNDAWTPLTASTAADHTQTITLQNATTGRKIGARATNFVSRLGFATTIGTTAANLSLAYSAENDDYTLSQNGKRLYPIPSGLVYAGSNDDQNRDANRPQGGAWTVEQVYRVTYQCQDEAGQSLGSFTCSEPAGQPFVANAPTLKNLEPIAWNEQETPTTLEALNADETIVVVYRRAAYAVTIESRDQWGALIETTEHDVPVGESLTLTPPTPAYYTLAEATFTPGTSLTPERDTTLTATYSTHAFSGVKALGTVQTKVEGGRSYLLYDASSDAARVGFRRVLVGDNNRVNRTKTFDTYDGLDPTHTWTLVKAGSAYKIRNEYVGLYVPALSNSSKITYLNATGHNFTFTLNADGETFCVKGSNGTCWDGVENGNLVGWNAPGHPIRVYDYTVQPYFEVEVVEQVVGGKTLATSRHFVKAGEAFTPQATAYTDYSFKGLDEGEQTLLDAVGDNITIHLLYDDLTPVAALRSQNKSVSPIYDLQGRRLAKVRQAGLYVVGGKKVVVK